MPAIAEKRPTDNWRITLHNIEGGGLVHEQVVEVEGSWAAQFQQVRGHIFRICRVNKLRCSGIQYIGTCAFGNVRKET